ncbi:conserved hypothetical protein [Trichormus variabilis ATCC 29413]|uniref:Uncharacterized protein n=2 Tax=Anabaena variabilis TaxID=264691 RepID=Q3M9N3_TRIV2|nr:MULTISPECIES: DUF6658 family protein [Nostocaceae]ABA22303.1 conserved hypothetical protein [Trichormus variabilis ATCC 29413]MBC1213527.1 hypothetical protein [Trichormus variabilis ARAD]MBC1254045.1 hypothetical protein [Trichormus variabilis V5]MBC1268191.1 hypothetical protein [Trichormus variabilis FSR]MBC1301835.1 hypothetical protein [Trichormus variabilis N2B]
MNSLTNIWKNLRLRQILTVFLAGILLMISTACSQGNPQGANPQNPAVQAGGANNPYKNGGDKYVNSRFSTDPNITNPETKKRRDQANLPSSSQILIAVNAVNRESELLYPGAETPAGRVKKEAELPIIREEDFQHPEPGGLIQNEPNVGTRIQERLETVKESVQEASKFIQNKADEGSSRPELQKNPAVGR